MSTKSTRKFPSRTEAKCPECGRMLSRGAELKRHRKTQHPDGTEVKAECPIAGCQYKAYEKSNLTVHINSKHYRESRHTCWDCDKGYASTATLVRHRKMFHGYQPYHTPDYLTKRALKEAEKQRGEATLSKTRDQQLEAASVVPHGFQNTSSSMDTESPSNVPSGATYHDDVPPHDSSDLKVSQDVQISVPDAIEPAHDTPNTLHL